MIDSHKKYDSKYSIREKVYMQMYEKYMMGKGLQQYGPPTKHTQ